MLGASGPGVRGSDFTAFGLGGVLVSVKWRCDVIDDGSVTSLWGPIKAQYDPDWNHEQSVMIQRWSGQHTCTVTVAVHRWVTWTETSHFFCFDCSSFVVVIVALHRTVLTPRTCILPVVSHCYLSELMSVLNINMVLLKVVVLHHRILSFTDMIF